MRVVWATDGPLTIRELYDRLDYSYEDVAYTTVATILQNLCRKGYVKGEIHDGMWEYQAATPLADHVADMIRALLAESPDKRRTIRRALGKLR
jgi:predicted transcriptional regulator